MVLVVVLALIVFFGAWAVSADVEQRTLAFGLPGVTPTLSGYDNQENNSGPYQIAPQANTGNAWVVNTTTGQLRLCRPPVKDGAAPQCWPWTQ